MTLPVNTVFPTYNNTSNYTGVNSAIRSAGLVSNPEQAEAVASAERDGRLGLSQFAFIKIPREVLFLQDERGAKLKSSAVASSTKSDLDEQRLLSKVEEPKIAIQGIGGQGGGNEPEEEKPPADDDSKPGFGAEFKTAPKETHLSAGLLGHGAPVYQGVAGANNASLAGRNISVLA
jgi:hypothetical protein